jgi:glycosyltransferase involved in cell wall biosynthesis
MNASVSVLVPTYNRADLLPQTIDSILSQSSAPAEVIVVDDGSTDDTRHCLRPFGNRVQYLHIENGGVCRARNIAVAASSSPYLAFCDSDDLWRNDKLEMQMAMHHSHPKLGFSFTNFSIVSEGLWSKRTKFDDAPSGFFGTCRDDDSPYFLMEQKLYEKILEFQPIFPSTCVITRALFQEIGGYREDLGRNSSEDLEFVLRCVRHVPVGVVNDVVVGIRKHESNISGDNYKTTKDQIEILNYALKNHLVSDTTRHLLHEQINRRTIDVSHDAFRRQNFREVVTMLESIPPPYLDFKTRLKLGISKMPIPMARAFRKAFLRG